MLKFFKIIGRPFVKRFFLCYRSVVCLSCGSCLSVCDVGVLWTNGWMDEDETRHRGRPRPRLQCVRWRPSSPSPTGHSPQSSAHVSCGQTAGWIKMPLGTEVGLGPGDIVLDGDPSHPKRGNGSSPLFDLWIVAKRLNGPICHLVRR